MSLHDGMHGDHIHHHEAHQDHLQHTTPSPDHHTPFSADMNIQYHDHHTTSHGKIYNIKKVISIVYIVHMYEVVQKYLDS